MSKFLSMVAVFCDYYNTPGDCEWHYKPCGANCMKTCRNKSGNCSNLITAVEGTVKNRFLPVESVLKVKTRCESIIWT